jgi:methylmalonyl-CoA/ethylmalonyl-CoA epimerase
MSRGISSLARNPMALGPIGLGQIALGITDVDLAEVFYGDKVGLKKLYRFENLVFFDIGGVRLMLGDEGPENATPGSMCLYLKFPDIVAAAAKMKANGISFDVEPHLLATMPDHELWMAFFTDPFGHRLALMCEKPLNSAKD